MLGAGAFMMLFGATSSAAIGITVQAITGLFAGADYAAGIKLLASWFEPRELGMVMGVFTTATSLGAVIANAIVPSVIEKSGWQTSYHAFGLLSIVVADCATSSSSRALWRPNSSLRDRAGSRRCGRWLATGNSCCSRSRDSAVSGGPTDS
jgi:sugar phosphate permease